MKLKNPVIIVICTVFASGVFAQNNKILRIGHRGAMGHITENTVESIHKALEFNCDMIEIDVFKLKSGELVVFHDYTLERLTNAQGNIEDYTLTELEDVIVDEKYKIPTLEEVIDIINKKAIVNIELKGDNTAQETFQVIQEFKARGWKNEDFMLSSFKWEELATVFELDPTLPLAVLTEKQPEDAIDFALQVKAKAINPHFKNVNEENVKLIHDANLKVYTWTVNSQVDIAKMKRLKVDGIISNFPERI